MNESEEEDEEEDNEEEDNEGDGDEGGENEEEEEEEDVEAGSEKEEEAQLTALEEQRMEGKVPGEQPHWPPWCSPGSEGQEPRGLVRGGTCIHRCLPCVPRSPG